MKGRYFSVCASKVISYSITIALIGAFLIFLGLGNKSLAGVVAGSIMVADDRGGTNSDGSVLAVNPDTGNRIEITDFGNPGRGPKGLSPSDLVVEPDGNLCVLLFRLEDSDESGIMHVRTEFGTRSILSDFADPAQGEILRVSRSIALSNDGGIYVADGSSPNNSGGLFRVDKETGFRTLVTDLSNPTQGPLGQDGRAAAVGPGGEIYFLAVAVNTDTLLFQVDPATGFRTVVSDMDNPAQGIVLDTILNRITINSEGNTVFVVGTRRIPNNLEHLVVSVDLTTGDRNIVSNFSNPSQGPIDTGPATPGGITINENGQLYVNTFNIRRLFRINPGSAFRTVVSEYRNPAQGPLGDAPLGMRVSPVAVKVIFPLVPTLSQWGLIVTAAVLGLIGFIVMRRRKVTA